MEDSSQRGDLVAHQSIGIARSVEPLMVVEDDRQLPGQVRDRPDDLRAQDRVRVHLGALVAREPLLLEQHRVRHTDLADVVEEAAPLERLQVLLAHLHRPPDVHGDLLDPPAVVARELVSLVHRRRQAADRLREHRADFDEAAIGEPARVHRHGEQDRRPPPYRGVR